MSNDIQPEVMLHLLCFQALEIAEDLNTSMNLKKSLRTIKNFTLKSVEQFEKTETGSEYHSRCIHNFNVILNAATKDVLLTPIGDFEIKT